MWERDCSLQFYIKLGWITLTAIEFQIQNYIKIFSWCKPDNWEEFCIIEQHINHDGL